MNRRYLTPKEVEAYCEAVAKVVANARAAGMDDWGTPVANGPTIAEMERNARMAKECGYIEY